MSHSNISRRRLLKSGDLIATVPPLPANVFAHQPGVTGMTAPFSGKREGLPVHMGSKRGDENPALNELIGHEEKDRDRIAELFNQPAA